MRGVEKVGFRVVPLLETKLHAPRQRRGVVPRARLHERLGAGDLPALVLVSAPAGFGKTTLLTGWLAATAGTATRTAWVSLDRRDSDPSLYWSYLIAALSEVVPEVGSQAAEVLRSAPVPFESVVGSLINGLARLDEDIVLVLDDYHLVESLEVHESMRFLVDHLPPQLHLVVASRADPPWPLGRLRARGELLEIRSADLRFTADETAAYLGGTSGVELSSADIEALGTRTEGWIAALQLAALSLQGRDDPAAFVAQFAGDDRFVVDYLADEVLEQQPDDVRRFLVETSILNRLTAPLCAEVTGRSDARSLLAELERSNLFLVALDDRRQWYRYHHLFGDVLRARLVDERPDRGAELHRRASAWFEATGDPAEAIRHATAAGDVVRAAELVELALPALRQTRQDATLRAWLDALPDEVFTDRPVLSLGRVGARMVTGDVAGVEASLDDIEAWVDGLRPVGEMIVHDHHEFRRLPAQTAMYRAALALLRGDLADTVAHAERTTSLCAEDDHLGRGAAAALTGLARWAVGDLERAADGYATAIREFESAGYLADILGCSLGLADIHVARGRLGQAERTLDAGLELAAAHGPLRGTADMHVGLAELHLERNELDAAAERLQASLELGEWLALAQHAYRWRVVDARLRSIHGDHAGALELLREAELRYDTDYSPKVRPVAATTARVRLAAGDLAGAERWAADAGLAHLDADVELTYLREYEHLTLARVLLAGGRADDAVPLLHRLLGAAGAGGRIGGEVEAGVLLALAHRAGGDAEAALAALDGALTRAAPERYVRVFLDAGAPMTVLLESVARQGWATSPAAAALLAAGGSRPVGTPQRALTDALSGRELDVLRLLRTDLTGPEIAAELFVSLNTVRTHTKHIFTKLGVGNRRAAVRRADELGL
jgi:LuxR family transcriptional regulator, maltose regulon positive regulatory protein